MNDPVDIQKPVVVRTMSKRTVRRISAFFGLFLVAFAVLFATKIPIRMNMQTAVSFLTSKPAPSISGIIHYGNKVLLADYSAHFVLVDFLASSCVQSHAGESGLSKFAQEYQKVGDFTVLDMVFSDVNSMDLNFMKRDDATYQAVVDSAGQIAFSHWVTQSAQSYLVPPNSVVLTEIIGPMNQSPLDRLIAIAKWKGC